MSLCQHDDCDREGIAAWNGCVFCDEHVRERLRTTADSKLLARIAELEAALRGVIRLPLMDNWEKYYHMERPDPLVQLAVVHAQFEIIH
jgi:hypothetical protein